MTTKSWCKRGYHPDGKRRFDVLTEGLCIECQLNQSLAYRNEKATKISLLQNEIFLLEIERNRLNILIDELRFQSHQVSKVK